MVDFLLPALGETVTEARISTWLCRVGDRVAEGQPLLEVETDKVDTELPSPVTGVLAEILVPDGEIAEVGAMLARIDTAPAPQDARTAGGGVPEPASASAPRPGGRRTGHPKIRSPLTRRLVREHDLDPDTIPGTGHDGRITAADLRAVIAAGSDPRPAPPSPAEAAPPLRASAPPSPVEAAPPLRASAPPSPRRAPAPSPAPSAAQDDASVFEPFNPIRRRTGERMLLSATTIPQVTTIVTVDYERVHQVRRAHAAAFKEREGFSLTYLPFVTYAVAQALQRFPHLNATVEDRGLRVHRRVHIGIAVDLDFQGLVVPVVHDAAHLQPTGLARRISALAAAARSHTLGLADVQGGTFTITNPGGHGTDGGTPLINPPQVAILSVEGISKRPVVVRTADGTEGFAAHHVGRLSLSWDHRAVDGAYAAAFLDDVRRQLETGDWAALL